MFYELAYIVPATLKPEELEDVKKRVNDIVEEFDGKIILEPPIEKRKLSYIIKRTRQGVFQYIRFSSEKENLDSIISGLKLVTEILRSQIVKLDATTQTEASKPTTMHPAPEPKKPRREEDSKKQAVLKEEKDMEKAPVAKAPKEKEKVVIEDLDKKIDELLGGYLVK